MATYTDQFYEMDPGNPPPSGTSLTVQTYSFEDVDNDDFIEPNAGETFDGSVITAVWVDDTITVEYPDGTVETITGTTFYTTDGRQVFTPTDGTDLQDVVFVSSTYVTVSTKLPVGDLDPHCFVAGTLILTDRGNRPVERLECGDLVHTRDHGLQAIRWIGSRTVPGRSKHAPIRFAAEAFGNPRALLVSPQHRMLITGWQAQLYFGEDEVLVPAKHLINGDTVHTAPVDRVTYHHLLFDRHELICSDGLYTESFHPGDHVVATDHEVREELEELFPMLANGQPPDQQQTARLVAKGALGRALDASFLASGAYQDADSPQ